MMNALFGKHERIRRKNDFQRVFQNGKKSSSSSCIVYSAVSPTQRCCRLGIVASRKVGNAVTRNRCKRIVREIFRTRKDIFPQGSDTVVVVRRNMASKCYNDVLEELCRIFR
ncbi:ribonuclease P protein component [candidate division KSB3 bacterium]|uniref:Ribonuclease P protein component n=1 Tax=candidate division KSB3 bacterium TaxID=2044937 RepID=A0A2G6K907_9BACT|nr:MAG: ribonuclease P protein component [candidate division KSB3 bacterium]